MAKKFVINAGNYKIKDKFFSFPNDIFISLKDEKDFMKVLNAELATVLNMNKVSVSDENKKFYKELKRKNELVKEVKLSEEEINNQLLEIINSANKNLEEKIQNNKKIINDLEKNKTNSLHTESPGENNVRWFEEMSNNAHKEIKNKSKILEEECKKIEKKAKLNIDPIKEIRNAIQNVDLEKLNIKNEQIQNDIRNLIARKYLGIARFKEEFHKNIIAKLGKGYTDDNGNFIKGYELSNKIIDKIMDLQYTKMDLEYSDPKFIEKIESDYKKYLSKNKENPKDFISYVSDKRKSDKKINEELFQGRKYITEKIDKADFQKTKYRKESMEDVKYALHAGTIVSNGQKSGKLKGISNILSEPMFFKTKEDLYEFLGKTYKSKESAKQNFDSSQIVEFLTDKGNISKKKRENFIKQYGKFGDIDNISNNIYGLDDQYYTQKFYKDSLKRNLANRTINAGNRVELGLLGDNAQNLIIDSLAKGTKLKKVDKVEIITTETNIENKNKVDNDSKNKQQSKGRSTFINNNNNEDDDYKQIIKNKVNENLAKLQKINPHMKSSFDDESMNLEEILSLYELRAKSNKENLNLLDITNEGLKYQKAVLQDIKSINDQINNINETGIDLKKEHVDILLSEQSTDEQKKKAKEQLILIDEEIRNKLNPLKQNKYNKTQELQANKKVIQDLINKELKKQNINPDKVNKVLKGSNNQTQQSSNPRALISDKGDILFGFGGGNNGNAGKGLKIIQSYEEAIQNVIMQMGMVKGIFNMLGSPIAYYVEQVKDYEEAVFDLGVVGQKSVNEIKELRTEFLNMASTSRFSATELTKATSEIIRVGRSYDEAKQILASSERLATASFEDLGRATDSVVKAMTAFDLSAESAAHVANSFHNIANTTPLSLQTFDESLRQTAAAFGAIVYFSSKSGTELEEYKKQVLDTTAVLTGLQSVLGRTVLAQLKLL